MGSLVHPLHKFNYNNTVKDLLFIGPELSHLIKLSATEWATQGREEAERLAGAKVVRHRNAPFTVLSPGDQKEMEVSASNAPEH